MPNPYRKVCPSCSRVFTHPPAYTCHVKAASCGGQVPGSSKPPSKLAPPAGATAALPAVRPAVGPPAKADGTKADGTKAEAAKQSAGAARSGMPLFFKQLESELLTSEIQFKDAKEQAAYVKDMARVKEQNKLTSDNIVVDFGWEPTDNKQKRPRESASWNAPAAHKFSEDSTEDSSDFERSDEENGPAPQPAPVRPSKASPVAAKSPTNKPAAGSDGIDTKYAALIAKLTTTPDEARLAAMSLDDLRFLLRKNGTSSHNMLKMPVVRCRPRASSTPPLLPTACGHQTDSPTHCLPNVQVSTLARIASTTGLKASVDLTSEPTGRKRQRSAPLSHGSAPTEKKRAADSGGRAASPAGPAVVPSRSSKRERKHTQLGSDYVDPSTIDQGYFHASIGDRSGTGDAAADKKKKKKVSQKLVAQSKLDEVMSKYSSLDSGFASPFQQQSKGKISSARHACPGGPLPMRPRALMMYVLRLTLRSPLLSLRSADPGGIGQRGGGGE